MPLPYDITGHKIPADYSRLIILGDDNYMYTALGVTVQANNSGPTGPTGATGSYDYWTLNVQGSTATNILNQQILGFADNADIDVFLTGATVTWAINYATGPGSVLAWRAVDLIDSQGATYVGYSGAASGLTASTVQRAIDETNVRIDNLTTSNYTWPFTFGDPATAVTNRYIDSFSGVRSNLIGYIPPYDSRIVAITFGVGATGATAIAEIYIGGTGATGYYTTLGPSAKTVVNTTFGPTVSISAGQEIAVRLSGSGINRPVITLLFERTA